jgi:hypothetical protein
MACAGVFPKVTKAFQSKHHALRGAFGHASGVSHLCKAHATALCAECLEYRQAFFKGLIMQTVAFFGHGPLVVRWINSQEISTPHSKNRPIIIAYRYDLIILRNLSIDIQFRLIGVA